MGEDEAGKRPVNNRQRTLSMQGVKMQNAKTLQESLDL